VVAARPLQASRHDQGGVRPIGAGAPPARPPPRRRAGPGGAVVNAPLALAALTASASASACVIDDRMITATPDPIAVGGFELGTLAADDPRFGTWSAYSYGMDQVSLRSTLAHIECNSIGCLSLDWQLADAADGAASQ